MARLGLLAVLVLALGPLAGCSFFGHLAGDLEGAFGGTSDGSCDRRYGASATPQPFCQEITGTIAVSQFGSDCTNHLQGLYDKGPCPRDATVLGGCKLDKTNEDGSQTTDWYYDVSALIDAGETFNAASLVHSADDVRAVCADPTRYSSPSATFVEP
jgi:hypothetical protein